MVNEDAINFMKNLVQRQNKIGMLTIYGVLLNCPCVGV